MHQERANEVTKEGDKLIDEGNHNADNIRQRSRQLQEKLDHLKTLGGKRKARLSDNSAFLQFIWKTDVVESWIMDKENQVQ